MRVVLNQVYFCIGAPKTGTTILARLLDQQPSVACIWEAYFLRPWHGSSVLNPSGKAWKRHGLPVDRVTDWHERAMTRVDRRGREMIAMRRPETFRAIVTEVFETFGELMSASIVGDKWPYYYRFAKLVLRAFPDAKLIYNVRDPRGVWNSGQTFRDRQAGDKILAGMLAADEAVSPHLPDLRFHTLRYEDLIADTHAAMSRLATFLGFDFDPDSISYDPLNDPLPNRWNWVPPARGELDPGLTDKWRDEMPRNKQEEVTRDCADFMSRYGYSECG